MQEDLIRRCMDVVRDANRARDDEEDAANSHFAPSEEERRLSEMFAASARLPEAADADPDESSPAELTQELWSRAVSQCVRNEEMVRLQQELERLRNS